ncbi:MAG: hypothetical protein HQK77_00185 [Desulfobacterales bacterium]|nr:hypothetical protein [Desulfobacterales bacterium]
MLMFDQRDYALLKIVNDVLSKPNHLTYINQSYSSYFHPLGIKELSETKGLRIAFSIILLLDTLEIGSASDRLNALRSLKSEVIDVAEGPLPKNTARVLLQLMKELVRAHGNERRQLELAHDFRVAASGKPRIVRKQLRHFHLLEMPEEWNQVSFDDHVHDINTKGRKTPTHLIMDAWIKGIRRLRVIYYNYIEPQYAAELMEAAQIMDITLRIGIEFSTRLRNKYIKIICVPRGFSDSQSFLNFLSNKRVAQYMAEARKVSEYQQRYLIDMIREFNKSYLQNINKRFDVQIAPLDQDQFKKYVGTSQMSLVHLSSFIYAHILPSLRTKLESLKSADELSQSDEQKQFIEQFVFEMNQIDPENIEDTYLRFENYPNVVNPSIPRDEPDIPYLLTLSPQALIHGIKQFHSAFRLTLNLSNLTVADVVEILYDCNGAITRLEMFNLKDFDTGLSNHIPDIIKLQAVINSGNLIQLKQVIREVIQQVEQNDDDDVDKDSRIKKITLILHDISTFKYMYAGSHIKARIGSDSTGRSKKRHGMGFVVKETLPRRAQTEIEKQTGLTQLLIPIHIDALMEITYEPNTFNFPVWNRIARLMQSFGWYSLSMQKCKREWIVLEDSTRMVPIGNIFTLGGLQENQTNTHYLNTSEELESKRIINLNYMINYMNTWVKNGLKILIGFIPAFTTFFLTQEWWILAYFGAVIWFAITGLRNILQSILGGGGFRRSPLLRSKELVNWERISDSLLFTGFSVPLLDYLVKTLLLDQFLGITVSSHSVWLYVFMALANGTYLSTHNMFRGLPKGVAIVNFFRSVLSIPIAILFNDLLGIWLTWYGVSEVNEMLQKCAAIISKTASDSVAGIIEGTADRQNNIKSRLRDYKIKIRQLYDIYTQLEILFPDSNVYDILKKSEFFRQIRNEQARDLEKIMIIHALDMLYFWLYQPRARKAFQDILSKLSLEERQIVLTSQHILLNYQEISRLFVDGILGQDFSRALSFYLDRFNEYVKIIRKWSAIYLVNDSTS